MSSTAMAAATTPARLSVDGINYLNIALMLVSGALALAFPFYLFLFAYAVLGPLHYLTEISWLRDRGFFMKGRQDAYPLVMVAVIVTMLLFWRQADPNGFMTSVLVLFAFAFAAACAFRESGKERLAFLAMAAVFTPLFITNTGLLLILGLLIPTLVHVFLFTGMFMLAGTLKTKRLSGTLSLIVFVGVAAILLAWHPLWLDSGRTSAYEQKAYGFLSESSHSTGFVSVNINVLYLLGFGPHNVGIPQLFYALNQYVYHDRTARAVMAFIAYAYTYHYLNWFSKTSVIGWHNASRGRLGLILGVWFASLGVYAVNYGLGLRWLFFLSFLHVLLEFPLNHIAFRNIAAAVLKPPARA